MIDTTLILNAMRGYLFKWKAGSDVTYPTNRTGASPITVSHSNVYPEFNKASFESHINSLAQRFDNDRSATVVAFNVGYCKNGFVFKSGIHRQL